MKNIKGKNRIKLGLALFVVVFLIILATHILTGTADFDCRFSISKYVGLTATSSIVFLISNTIIAYLAKDYIFEIAAEKINKKSVKSYKELNAQAKAFYITGVVIMIMLIVLSMCPINFYDNILPSPVIFGRAPISLLHVISSRSMFGLMVGFALYTAYLAKKKQLFPKKTMITCILFAIYGLICMATCIFLPSIFWGFDLYFESAFIIGFFITLLAL